MNDLKTAVEEFQNRQFGVYKADPSRLVRDASIAKRTAKDHMGRWFFELFQNSDDAQSTEVLVRVTTDSIYVADQGKGLLPSAVRAISGTDLSDKTRGTIGRKGVGFKAVYEISENPTVHSVNAEGLEFSAARAAEWLVARGLESDPRPEKVPFQWLPFWVTRTIAEANDPVLEELKDYSTVIKLPVQPTASLEEIVAQLAWSSYCLLPFNYVKKLEVRSDSLSFELEVAEGADIWTLRDSREQGEKKWRVTQRLERCPEDILKGLDSDDRAHIENVELKFLVAAPMDHDDVVRPTNEFLPLHVFYPTKDRGPIRVLLHAEFLVKSDRTSVLSPESNEFNRWIAERLVNLVLHFVQSQYDPRAASAYLRLLLPFPDRESHDIAKSLWEMTAKQAVESLLLPDVAGVAALPLDQGRILTVSVAREKARRILEETPEKSVIVNAQLDTDEEASEVLRALGCGEFSDADIIKKISECATDLRENHDWVWTAWEWLASWLADKPWDVGRIEQARHVPLVPVGGALRTAWELKNRTVTWWDSGVIGPIEAVPEWLPLSFVEPWLVDFLRPHLERAGDPLRTLADQLHIRRPTSDVVRRAVSTAIKDYWKDEVAEPSKFLEFILLTDWENEIPDSEGLQLCPIPAMKEGDTNITWVPATEAYFGRQWGENLLADLYAGVEGIHWAQPFSADGERERAERVYEWLGVQRNPRVVSVSHENTAEGMTIWDLPDEYVSWRNDWWYLVDGPARVRKIQKLDRVEIGSLDKGRARHLLCILSKYWHQYYEGFASTTVSFFRGRRKYPDSCSVESFWLFQVRTNQLPPLEKTLADPTSLSKCWLPDNRARRAIGDFLPIIDSAAFDEHKNGVEEWLVNVIHLRTRIDEVTVPEWKDLLTERIPRITQEALTNQGVRYRVLGCYEACLDALDEKGNISDGVLHDVPLLCHRGTDWKFVNEEDERWLADDNQFVEAFGDELYLFPLPPVGYRQSARKFFGIRALSGQVTRDVLPGQPIPAEGQHLQAALDRIVPCVFAWRCSQTKLDADRLAGQIRALTVTVVENLRAALHLGQHGVKEIDILFAVEDNRLLINHSKSHGSAALAYLGSALAEFLDRKSDAEFYENLLRCVDEEECRNKLLSKNVSDDDISRYLRQYSGQTDQPFEPINQPADSGIIEKGTAHAKQAVPKVAGSPTETPETPPIPVAPTTSPSPSTGAPFGPVVTPSLRLKNPETGRIKIVGEAYAPRTLSESAGSGSGVRTAPHPLSHDEKLLVERCGRRYAGDLLKEHGYAVEQMPQENPGFDIKATKGEKELRVEVKAHLAEASSVKITLNEVKESAKCNQGKDQLRWELWNVENLSEDTSGPIMRRFETVPDDALKATEFALDLTKCVPISTQFE